MHIDCGNVTVCVLVRDLVVDINGILLELGSGPVAEESAAVQ